MGIDIDPLGDVSLFWLIQHARSLCTCAARDDDCMRHSEDCNMTKEYAQLVSECEPNATPVFIGLEIQSYKHTLAQSLIKCAQCGRLRLGKDMDVIYRHWDSDPDPFNIANIKKAVCPEHNRKGTVGWVHERS